MRIYSLIAAAMVLLPIQAFAHCDTPSGPVVAAAKKALESKSAAPVLIWVRPEDEAEISGILRQVLAVRTQSKEAQVLADQYFFESVVRIHRAGEGECYTGIKEETESHFANEVEAALNRERPDALIAHLNKELQENTERHFSKVVAKKGYDKANVEAGREYVREYVSFIHYIGNLYQAIEAEGAPPHSEETRKE